MGCTNGPLAITLGFNLGKLFSLGFKVAPKYNSPILIRVSRSISSTGNKNYDGCNAFYSIRRISFLIFQKL